MKQKKYKRILILIIAISILITLLLSPIFAIKNISINEVDKIKSEDIFNEINLLIGDNIFLSLIKNGNILSLDYTKSIDRIKSKFKTLKNINIYAVLPNQVIVEYKIANEVFEIIKDQKFIVTDEDGYVLDINDEHKKGRIKLTGLDFSKYSLYSFIDINETKLEYMKIIYRELLQYDSEYYTAFREYIDWIDFNRDDLITIMYDNRVLIKIEIDPDLSYKIESMCVILSKQIGPKEKGILDMTKGDISIFTPE